MGVSGMVTKVFSLSRTCNVICGVLKQQSKNLNSVRFIKELPSLPDSLLLLAL
jgi:uncharacterized membrane protein SirB2